MVVFTLNGVPAAALDRDELLEEEMRKILEEEMGRLLRSGGEAGPPAAAQETRGAEIGC